MEEALIRKILNNNPILRDNPMALNAIGLFRNGQVADLEMLARNIYQSKGQDINEALKQFQ